MSCNTCSTTPEQRAVYEKRQKRWGWLLKYEFIWRYIKTKIWSPKVSTKTYVKRLATCMACHQMERDNQGRTTTNLLRREVNGRLYCGAPRTDKLVRDEAREGCGCSITDKAHYKYSECPRVMWGPGDKFNDRYYVDVANAPRKIRDMIDLFVPAHLNPKDNHGMGDTVLAIPVARAVQAANPTKAVRIRTTPVNFPWLTALGWNIFAPHLHSDRAGDAEIQYWLTERHNPETDLRAKDHGTSRIIEWCRAAGVREPIFPESVPYKESALDPKLLDKMAEIKALGGKIAVLAPFSNGQHRTWPLIYWLQLQQELAANKVYSVVIDGPGDGARTSIFPTMRYWGVSPEFLIALASKADVLVSNDSGLAHLGGYLKRPTLAICGPTIGEIVFGGYPTVEPIQAQGPCTGCYWHTDRGWRYECNVTCELLMNLKPSKIVERVINADKALHVR